MSGGGKPSTKVAQYFMSLHFGVCAGPVDSVNRIWVNEKEIFWDSGYVSENKSGWVDATWLFGGEKKEGGVKGYIDFMLGGQGQKVTAAAAERMNGTPDTLPGFRGITSLFFHDADPERNYKGFYWSANVAYLRPVWVQVTRIPEGPLGKDFINGDANPADMIFEILTNRDWGIGMPRTLLDTDSFGSAAQTLRNENFGLSIMWTRSSAAEKFIGEVLDHIQATLSIDPKNGLLRLRLLRDDYDRNNLFVVHPGNASLSNVQRKAWGDTANEVTVTYTDPENEKEVSLTEHDNANISIQGGVISTSRNYYGVRSASLARRLAKRDLRQASTPLLGCTANIDRRAWNLIPGDVIEIRWPEYGMAQVYMRVTSVDYGKPGDSAVKVEATEDIFSYGTSVFTEIKESDGTLPPPPDIAPPTPTPDDGGLGTQDPVGTPDDDPPEPLDHHFIASAPYFMVARRLGDEAAASILYPNTVGLLLTAQDDTSYGAIDYWSEDIGAVGNAAWGQQGSLANLARGTLAGALPFGTQSTLPLDTGSPVSTARVGDFILLTSYAGDRQEMTAVVNDAGSTVVLRGLLDTIPQQWAAGTIAWVIPPNRPVLDQKLRAAFSEVKYRFTPRNSQGVLPYTDAPTRAHTVDERLQLPLRPADVKINGSSSGELLLSSKDFDSGNAGAEVTWSRRNRLQESAQVLSWSDPDVVPEPGQTTTVSVTDAEGTVLREYKDLEGTSLSIPFDELASLLPVDAVQPVTLVLSVYAERDGLPSFAVVTRQVSIVAYGYGFNYGLDYGFNYAYDYEDGYQYGYGFNYGYDYGQN